jgi:hypothetical protein
VERDFEEPGRETSPVRTLSRPGLSFRVYPL